MSTSRKRLRELGISIGVLPPGPHNAITDVAGVRVGHTTLIAGAGPLQPGRGPIRTGVTLILPHGGDLFAAKAPAAVHSINGFGKAFGFEQVREMGQIEAPIALTNTLNVGKVADALMQHGLRTHDQIGLSAGTYNVVVGETNDGYLNDIRGLHVQAEHVWAALDAASSDPPAEGAVGAGAGVSCFGWKGGIGTASRVLPPALGGYTVGALVQTNFGEAADLVVAGLPLGRFLTPPPPPPDDGSIMVVLATDAPLDARGLRRLCVRAAAGIARTGGLYAHASGDFVIGFSVAYHIPHYPDQVAAARPILAAEALVITTLFRAVVESVEEAILNAMCMAETTTGRDGHVRHALPLDALVAWHQRWLQARPF